MAIARPILGLVALILLAGGIVLEFLVILSGSPAGTPENQVFFLQSTTNGITGGNTNVHNPTRWTWLAVCGEQNGLNYQCGHATAALPFDPPRNFGTTTGIPTQFIGTRKFYYLSRFAWALYIVSVFFAVVAFFTGFLGLCFRLGAYLTGLNAALAMFFQAVTAALMTAWVIIGRNALRSSGQTANIGVKAMAFTWAAFAAWLIATVLFCVGGGIGKDESRNTKSSYFGRKRSTRSRGSFIDSESQRRVKDEYD
ncbi:hypothetical protein BAUCODRAFT_155457 [Baudoinia panamericana UAMH 10762]|uniref:SUR7-domain-containing protein n=1 Tax=Baudoinia panamericana (strain UAMH 10762) TaxID=717646 RepID=M2NG33_BAUPA|nr:uncharacterized protein BAUCODRAFT_155457 [Baudoinia panamericana UAMH 10762]EMC98254.1 hypothetical protein BAUCODRAFT_155457 [Baudoinia panamericana UAMH 10762]